jgi:hypothetical protein
VNRNPRYRREDEGASACDCRVGNRRQGKGGGLACLWKNRHYQ